MRSKVRLAVLLVAGLASFAMSAMPAVAAPVTESPFGGSGQFCSYDLDDQVGWCSESADSLARYQAESDAVLLATLYNSANLSTATGAVNFTGERACTASYDSEYNLPDLRPFIYPSGASLNNTSSSLSTASQCDVKLYDGFSYSGSTTVWIDRCVNLATCISANWTNRASSLRIS